MKPEPRPSWDQYFMSFANLAKSRSTCLRRQVGAVAVRNRQVLATGYNGSPKGTPHCAEIGCIREQRGVESGTRHELCRGVHAEQNVIAQAAYQGTSLKDATLYTTLCPCIICMKLIVNSGIREIFYVDDYPDSMSLALADSVGLALVQLKVEGEIR
jgi:dCMP deaminase